MSEKDDAEYYQSHKDDSSEWGEPLKQRKPERRKLGAMVSIRLSPEEHRLVRRAAELRGTSVSNFIRQLVLDACSPAPAGGWWASFAEMRTSVQGAVSGWHFAQGVTAESRAEGNVTPVPVG
jgi:hypothetical protein